MGGPRSEASLVSVVGRPGAWMRLQLGAGRGSWLALAPALCLSVCQHGRLCLLLASLWLCVGLLPPLTLPSLHLFLVSVSGLCLFLWGDLCLSLAVSAPPFSFWSISLGLHGSPPSLCPPFSASLVLPLGALAPPRGSVTPSAASALPLWSWASDTLWVSILLGRCFLLENAVGLSF